MALSSNSTRRAPRLNHTNPSDRAAALAHKLLLLAGQLFERTWDARFASMGFSPDHPGKLGYLGIIV